ncbi:MAG: FISUMP domain-containing protein [Bacteroidota bacterium]
MKSPVLFLSLFLLLASGLSAQEYIKDASGNKYEVIEHNGYLIMTENLRTDRFRDGSKIPKRSYDKWDIAVENDEAAYCYPGDYKGAASLYGNIYTRAAIQSEKGLAPEGWFIPTLEEWKEILWWQGSSYIEKNTTNQEKSLHLVNTEDARKWRKQVAKGKTSIIEVSTKFGARANGYRAPDGSFKEKEYGHFACRDGSILFIATKSGGGARLIKADTRNGLFVRCVKKIEK